MKQLPLLGAQHVLARALLASPGGQTLLVVDDEQALGAAESAHDALVVFLDDASIAALLDQDRDGLARRAGGLLARAGARATLHLAAFASALPTTGSVHERLQAIERPFADVLNAGAAIRSCAVADCAGDAGPVDAGLDRIAQLLDKVARREPRYLAHYGLTLPASLPRMALLSEAGVTQALTGLLQESGAGRHLVVAEHALDSNALAGALAAATGVRVTVGDAASSDCVGAELDTLLDEMASPDAPSFDGLGIVHANALDVGAELRRRIEATTPRRAFDGPFDSLPGLERVATARPGLHYRRLGTGATAVLLVNAFGLSMDFWSPLTARLGAAFTLLAPERAAAQAGGIPQTYYGSDRPVEEFVDDVRAILAEAGVTRVHVLSWCGGVKLAMELAEALPEAVRSLGFVAPSFAGTGGPAGADSVYEKNLLTMCGMVAKMPKTAATMAANMRAILARGDNDIDRFRADRKDRVQVFELADKSRLPQLYQPFLDGDSLAQFSAQLVRFRAHDVAPLLPRIAARRTPTLLLTGRHDATTSSARAREICTAFEGRREIELRQGSHYMIDQDADAVAALYADFMREHGGTPG